MPKKTVYSEDEPLYKQISSLLADEIRRRHTPGDTLPGEFELAKRYGVNRHTLRRALQELVNEGIVGKVQGRGTVVQQKLIDYSINSATKFTETLERNGRKAETIVLRKTGIPAHGEIAELLKIAKDEPVALVETLRKMDGIPFSVVSHYLPLERVFDVLRIYRGGSLHVFLLEHYSIRVKRTLSMITALLPQRQDIDLLGIMENSPIIQVKSINVDQETDQPMELAVSRFNAASVQITVEPLIL